MKIRLQEICLCGQDQHQWRLLGAKVEFPAKVIRSWPASMTRSDGPEENKKFSSE